MNSIGSGTAKTARDLAIQAAKQMAKEPLEVLKTAKEQVTPSEAPKGSEVASTPQSSETPPQSQTEQQKAMDKVKGERRMEALERELEDIRKQDVFKDLQEKISQGQEVMLEEYPELSQGQKEALEAQMETVRNQIAAQKAQGEEVLQVPVSKKGRKMTGQKQEAEKQQTRVEKPVPPSG